MTPEQLEKRVEYWRKRVTPEWRVAIMSEPSADAKAIEGSCAHVQSDLRVQEIRLYFAPMVLDMARADVDRVIVHELLHPLLDRVLDHDVSLEAYVPPVTIVNYRENRSGDMEEFVNRIAHLIVDPSPGDNYRTARVDGSSDDVVEKLDEQI